MNDYTPPRRPFKKPPPQVGHGRVDHHRIITCSEGETAVAMETPFRNPMIPRAHAAFSLIFLNSYWSILRFGYEWWKTLALINTQCAAIWMSRIIILKWAAISFTLASIVILVHTTNDCRTQPAEYRVCTITSQHLFCIIWLSLIRQNEERPMCMCSHAELTVVRENKLEYQF